MLESNPTRDNPVRAHQYGEPRGGGLPPPLPIHRMIDPAMPQKTQSEGCNGPSPQTAHGDHTITTRSSYHLLLYKSCIELSSWRLPDFG